MPGKLVLLESSSSLEDENFQQAVLLITEQNDNGATGFVLNHPFHRALNELEEFKQAVSFPLYVGGPVEREKLYFIHRRPDLVEGGALIAEGIYLGGNFEQAVAHLNSGRLSVQDMRVFLGYCGWDAGELEDEVNEGSWNSMNKPFSEVFAST